MISNNIAQYFIPEILGYRNEEDTRIPAINPNIVNDTFCINEIGSIITLSMIYDSLEEFDTERTKGYPTWNNATNYIIGDKVNYTIGTNTFTYICVADNISQNPQNNLAFWETLFSKKLREYAINFCYSALTNILTSLKNNSADVSTYTTQNLYSDTNTFQVKTKQSLFVGTTLRFPDNPNATIQIQEIGLLLTESQTLPIYVFHSSQSQPIQIINLNFTSQDENKFVWKPLNLKLDYFSSGYNSGGYFTIGFYESDIIGNYYYMNCSKNLNTNNILLTSFYCNEQTKGINPTQPFPYATLTFSSDVYFNVKYNLISDFTSSVLLNKMQYANYLKLFFQIKFLQAIENSTRINRNKMIGTNVYAKLYGHNNENRTYAKGLVQELESMTKLLINNLQQNNISKKVRITYG